MKSTDNGWQLIFYFNFFKIYAILELNILILINFLFRTLLLGRVMFYNAIRSKKE